MKLESVRLRNFRLFSDVTCDLHPELTVFIANNGGGKTSILDAIRILFDTYLGAFPSGKGRGIRTSDVRTVSSNGEMPAAAQAYPVEIAGNGKLAPTEDSIAWQRALNTAKAGTTVKDARPLAQYAAKLYARAAENGTQQDWPLLAYYGTGRLWNQKKLTAGKMFASGFDARAAAYIDCMEPASSYKYFAEWFAYAYRSITQSKIRFMETTPGATAKEILAHQSAFSPLVSAVQNAVNIVLAPTGWKNLWYSESRSDVTMGHDDFGVLTVSQLSDGIRNSLGMVADIAFRAVQLNPHLGAQAAQATAGIVLIDEVDMHLHPSWQQVFLANLREAFPLVQFIVTTHSPQVLTSIDASSIRILQQYRDEESGTQKSEVKHVTMQTKGVASSDLLAEIMGVDPVPDVPESRMLAEYHALIQQNLHEESLARKLRVKLDAHFGPSHPLMLECDRMIRLQGFKQRLPAAPFAADHQPG
ncbi:AAA family ATPase [Duganella sp. HH105]|uniref:AAA family ATPase n=1 Tax=Duganella sp. HH105 TaxID=1781067 RepID=UPI000877C7F3|nr:AAA family ATPase [Duganella sp. HH105]OEZ55444.1 DNA replication and repair protein RecF [Duganella sp. HH105]